MEQDHTYTDQELDALDRMFGEPGWTILVRDAKDEIYELQAQAVENTKTMEEVTYLRGQAVKLASLIALPAIVANYRQELENADV